MEKDFERDFLGRRDFEGSSARVYRFRNDWTPREIHWIRFFENIFLSAHFGSLGNERAKC